MPQDYPGQRVPRKQPVGPELINIRDPLPCALDKLSPKMHGSNVMRPRGLFLAGVAHRYHNGVMRGLGAGRTCFRSTLQSRNAFRRKLACLAVPARRPIRTVPPM